MFVPAVGWVSWLKVKTSQLENAGDGLFALGEIRENETITVYMGSAVIPPAKPFDEKYAAKLNLNGVGHVTVDARGPRWKMTGNVKYMNPPLLGGHFINEPSDGDTANAELKGDGCIVALKPIKEGEEITMWYDGRKDAKETKEQGLRKRRKRAIRSGG